MTQPSDVYNAEDVITSLAKTDTSDGPGFDSEEDLPESDFVSFSEDDVEGTVK